MKKPVENIVNTEATAACDNNVVAASLSCNEGSTGVYIVANPIYDTVFKHLMENHRVARFFIETMIDQPVENVTVTANERTFYKIPSTISGKELTKEQLSKIAGVLSIIRYDFIATIRTPDGYKKVLIEIQKAKNADCIKRFRDYVGEQYQRQDVVEVDGKEVQKPLLIITIYLLGYNLRETEATVIHVSRQYRDVLGDKKFHLQIGEVLVILSSSAVTNELSSAAIDQLRQLEGAEAHATYMISNEEQKVYGKLGINLTQEAVIN